MAVSREDRMQIPPVSPSPWLLYTHGNAKSKRIQTFTTLSPNHSYIKCIPSLQGKRVQHVSPFGWLILRHLVYRNKFHLWDPLTSSLIDLPPVNSSDFNPSIANPRCILTNNPTNKNEDDDPCIVLVFCERFVFSYCINRHQQDNNNWISLRLKLQVEGSEAKIKDAIVAGDGKIYAMVYAVRRTFLVTLEITANEEEEEIVPSITLGPFPILVPYQVLFPIPKLISSISYLVESCGMVYFISALMSSCNEYKHVDAIKLWQLDWDTTTWVEVHSLDDRAFFLNNVHGSTWCWANNGAGVGMEPNSVYFLGVELDIVYHYRFHDHSLTPLRLTPELVNTPYFPAWVSMPHHHQRKPQEPLNNDQETNNFMDFGHDSGHDSNENKMTFTYDLTTTLHGDLVSQITKYLFWNDYLSLRATCKSLQSQLPLLEWRANSPLPLFLFSNNIEGGLCQIMDPQKNDSRSITIPFPPRFKHFIDYSQNGWLLFCVGEESLQYYNLFTGVKGEFPSFDNMHIMRAIGFSTSPTSSDCLTFGILLGHQALNIAYYCNGEELWNITEFGDEDEDIYFGSELPGTSNPVFLHGGVYFLYLNARLWFFELEQGEPSLTSCEKTPKLKDSYYQSNHLVVCDGELVSVFIGDMAKWVQVFRFNHSEHEWIELESIGNNTLFIGQCNSFSVVARDGEMNDRIYLSRLYNDEVVFYSMVTHKFHTSRSKHCMDNLCGTSQPIRCCWV